MSIFTKRLGVVLAMTVFAAVASAQSAGRPTPVVEATSLDLAVNKFHEPNQGVALWNVGIPLDYVITVKNVGTAGSSHVSVTDALPAGFVVTKIQCGAAFGAVCPSTPLTAPTLGEFAMPANDSNITLRISGYYKTWGTRTNLATATAKDDQGKAVFAGDHTSGTDPLDIPQNAPVPVDLDIDKTVAEVDTIFDLTAATPEPRAVLRYTIVVKNNSAIPVYLGGIMNVRDVFKNPSGVAMDWTASGFKCQASSGTMCPDMYSSPVTASLGGQVGLSFPFDRPNEPADNDLGFMAAGGSFTITYDVELKTSAKCSVGAVQVTNQAFLDLFNGTTFISDNNANNTSKLLTSTITGLPATCPEPPAPPIPSKVQEPLTSSTAWAPGSVTYTVSVKNPRTTAMTDLPLGDAIYKFSGTPPFTAVITDGPKCVSGCSTSSLAPIVKYTPSVTADNTFYPLWSAALPLLPAMQTAVIRYTVVYTPVCETDRAKDLILNRFTVTITDTQPSGLKVTTSKSSDAYTFPEEAGDCTQWKISKTPAKPVFSKFGDTLEYDIEYRNESSATRVMGTLRDVASISSDQNYGPLQVSYSTTCSTAGITNGPPASSNVPSATLNAASNGWLGTALINASNVKFDPGATLKCHVKITPVQPAGPVCQGKGTAKLINSALMDLSEFYNPNTNSMPLLYATTEAELPLCRKAIITKSAVIIPPAHSAEYGPGTLFTYKITATNSGTDDLAGLTLKDAIPPPLVAVSVKPCTPLPSACSSPPTLTFPASQPSGVIEAKYAPLKAGQAVTFEVTVKAPQAGGTYTNVAHGTFLDGGKWYFQGDPAQLDAEENIAVLTPKLAKNFDPEKIGPTGTSTLTFNITNTASDPPQSGMSFTDSLPAGLTFTGTPTSTCGKVSVSADGRSLSLTNGALATGVHTCKVTATVAALGVCGIYKNAAANFTNVSNVDVSKVDEQLEVGDCPVGLVVRKNVVGAPAGFQAQFNFTVKCTSPTAPYTKSFTVGWPAPGFVTLTDIPAGSQCTVTEGAMPAAPSGFTWTTPVYTPAGGVATVGAKGAEVAVRNALERQQDCVTIINSEASCEVDKDGKPTGGYVWKFRFRNFSGRPISHVFITGLPSPVAAVPFDSIALVPPVTSVSAMLQVTFKNAKPGPLDFTLSFQDQGFECCTMPVHLELPPCDCAQVTGEVTPSCFFPYFNVPPPYLYTFKLQNLSTLPVDHVFVAPVSPLDHVTPIAASQISVSKSVHPIPTLQPGGTMATPITVAISGSQAVGGQQVCLSLTLRSTDPNNCCCSIVRCFRLPDCSFHPPDTTPIGNATLTPFGTGYLLDDLGSTGEDGMGIALHGARAAQVAWRPLEDAGPLPDGAYIELRAAQQSETSAIRVTKAGSEYRISATDPDTTAYTAEVFQNGVLVDSRNGLRGINIVVIWPVSAGAEVVPAEQGQTVAFTLGSGEPVPWRLADGSTITGDRLRLTPEEPGSADASLQRLELRAANIPFIKITGSTVFHDCNGNGTPDADDIASGASADANGNGIPDECEGETDLSESLNTGFDQVSGAPLPFGELPDGTDDDEWRIVAPGAERPAKVVIRPIWAAPLPDTRWISVDPDQGTSIPGVRDLVFQRCFCVAETAGEIRFQLQLRADNEATVFLNGRQIGAGGAFNDANPLSIVLTGHAGDGLFVAGQNCLTVDVSDRGVVGGLTLAGSVTAANGRCVRR